MNPQISSVFLYVLQKHDCKTLCMDSPSLFMFPSKPSGYNLIRNTINVLSKQEEIELQEENMNLQIEAMDHYEKALKQGRKAHRESVHQGKYPYLQALDDILEDTMVAGQVDLGILDIPMEKIVQVRREAKRKVFVTNAFRALKKVAPEHNLKNISNVVLVGGSDPYAISSVRRECGDRFV